MGLKPLRVAVWGPFVLLKVTQATWKKEEDVESDGLVASEWLGSSAGRLSEGGVDSHLSFICRREYTIDCNWKVKILFWVHILFFFLILRTQKIDDSLATQVFCDNYLDGGYHVPYAHKGLMSGLDLETYSTTVYSHQNSSL